MNTRNLRYATFYVEGLYFGVDVLEVQEVLRFQEMTPVPMAPGVIQGLMNLRGQIVTALDMRRRLGLGPRPPDSAPMNMVVRSDDGAVSLLVDEIGDVIDVNPSGYEPCPENLPAAHRDLIAAMYKLEERLLLVLDLRNALDTQRFAEAQVRS